MINPDNIMIEFTAPEDRIIRSVSNRVTERVTEKVTEKEQEILLLLLKDPGYTYAQLADKLKVSNGDDMKRLKG